MIRQPAPHARLTSGGQPGSFSHWTHAPRPPRIPVLSITAARASGYRVVETQIRQSQRDGRGGRLFSGSRPRPSGGRAWTYPSTGAIRVYLNNWTDLLGLSIVTTYGTGNISAAVLDGQPISNVEARRILGGDPKVWWENGAVHITGGTHLAQHYLRAVTAAVADAVRARNPRRSRHRTHRRRPRIPPNLPRQRPGCGRAATDASTPTT